MTKRKIVPLLVSLLILAGCNQQISRPSNIQHNSEALNLSSAKTSDINVARELLSAHDVDVVEWHEAKIYEIADSRIVIVYNDKNDVYAVGVDGSLTGTIAKVNYNQNIDASLALSDSDYKENFTKSVISGSFGGVEQSTLFANASCNELSNSIRQLEESIF